MKTLVLGCLLWSSLSLSAQAHEIWIERDGAGPVRVNFGEPAETATEGEDELGRVKDFDLFGVQGKAGPARREGDHLVAPLAGEGDAWLFDGDVFEPWQGEGGGYESVTYYARAGRQSTSARLAFELVPTQAGGDTFTALFRKQPLAEAEVTVIDPQKWSKTLKTDKQGRFTLPALRDGRHIVVVSHKEPVQQQVAGKQLAVMHHISTLTFAAE